MRKGVFFVFLFLGACVPKNKYDLPRSLTSEEIKKFFPKSVNLERNEIEKSMIRQGLVDIQSFEQDILVNLKYSSGDNFFAKDVYGTLELAYLQEAPALALLEANNLLKKLNPNLRLLVYDAARPQSVQHILWQSLDTIPEQERKKYVSPPEEASLHNYGCAVDLTIYDLDTKRAMDMGTEYDFFGELAYPRMERQMINEGKLSLKQLNNRILLRTVMEQAGFTPITTEWWHFNFYSRSEAARKYQIVK